MARRDPYMQGTYIEPMGEGPGFFGRVLPFLVGILLGLIVVAVIVANPTAIELAWVSANDAFAELAPDNADMLPVLIVILLVAVVVLARKAIFGSAALWGMLVGAFLWVPFGNHILSEVPQVEEALPGLRAGLDDLVAGRNETSQIRTWAEETIPVRNPAPAAPVEEAEPLPQTNN